MIKREKDNIIKDLKLKKKRKRVFYNKKVKTIIINLLSIRFKAIPFL